MSVGRGNGKSALVAAVATAVVDPGGPLHGPRREVIAVASSFQQGRVIFEDVLAFLRARHGKLASGTWRLQDSTNNASIEHRPSGARVRCIGSDPARAHGLRPFLVLADEPAQWERSTRDRMFAALSTSLGKVPGSKLIALGTRPASSEHWFTTMLADPERSVVYAARPGDAPFTLRAIRKANPSYDHLPSLRATLEREAVDAKRDSGQLAAWMALRLNMGTSDTVEAMILDAETWRKAEGEALPIGPYALGFDLGGAAAMSACAAYWPATGRLDCFAAFPRVPDLRERGLADQVGPEAYLRMAERGELIQAGERVPDIARLLAVAVERWGVPSAVATDRYRADELLQVLEASALPVCPLSERGMGFKDGAEDLRQFVPCGARWPLHAEAVAASADRAGGSADGERSCRQRETEQRHPRGPPGRGARRCGGGCRAGRLRGLAASGGCGCRTGLRGPCRVSTRSAPTASGGRPCG